ncbi:MAG: peptidoglycan DD-metalloendopeptidase family protein [Bacteroidetes bacterium]|nr:peptidoglycan DD-metalloendopeptidase family protein [Bacteroidota bacterium]
MNILITKKLFPCLLLLCICLTMPVFGQKKIDNLRKESDKAKKEIEQNARLLKQTEASKNASVQQLNLLNLQIIKRHEYTVLLSDQARELEKEIAKSSVRINSLQQQLAQLQTDYKQALFTLYKQRSQYDQLIFVMSAESYNQAFNRMKYLQYYSDYIDTRAAQIQQMHDSIVKQKAKQQDFLTQKQVLLGVQKTEAQKLESDKTQQDKVVQQLTAQQQKLQKDIEAKRALAKKLDKQIEDIVKEELRKAEEKRKAEEAARKKAEEARKKAEEEARKKAEAEGKPAPVPAKPANANVNAMSPQDALISKNFVENKGRMPWPTTQGVITQRFGTHKHPTLGYDVESNGVEFTVPQGSKARAIFDGEVTRVVMIPGKNTIVIIKHGTYFSVYDNLIDVTVSNGQKVSAKQELGTVFTDPETGTSVLQLQIWKELNKLNPEPWITK